MSETRARRSWRPLLGGALLWAMWLLCLVALRELFVGGAWTWRALVSAAAVVLGAGALQTAWPRRRAPAWVLGVAAGGGLLALWMLGDGRLSGWLGEPLRLIQETWIAASEGVPPVELSGALLDVVLSAWFIGLALSSLLFTRFGWLFAAGIVPALLLLAPVVVTSLRVPVPLLLCAGALLLLLLWLESPPVVGRWRGIAAAGLALALAAGLVVALPPVPDRVWNSAAVSVSPVSSSVPDVTVALARDLQSRSDTIAFDYRSPDSEQPIRFTLAVLSDFERGTWLPEDELDAAGATVDAERGAEPADGAGTGSFGEQPAVTVRSKGLVSSWLPLPQGVERVEAAGGDFDASQWIWVDGTATARSETALTRPGDQYRAFTGPRSFGEFWQPERPVLDEGERFDPEPYLALPDGVPAAIAEAAREATAVASAGTDRGLGTATMLGRWFRSGEFVYDERAPYEPGADPDDPYAVMEAFLAQRSGYCVHFASTYAVMARTLGLPSRVSVGYVSRPSSTAGWTSVRARELHAWPEVYIEGLGWIAFEPTPGGAGFRAETGQPYQEETEPDADPAAPVDAEDAPETDGAPEDQTAPEDPGAGLEEDAGASGDPGAAALPAVGIPLALLGLLLVLLGVAPAVRLGRRLRRRRRARRGIDPASQAWAELVDTAVDLGRYRPAAAAARARTPEAVVEHLEGRGLLGEEGAAVARTLATAVSEERYAGPGGGASARDAGSVLAAAELAAGSLRTRSGRRARLRAAVLPRSVVGR